MSLTYATIPSVDKCFNLMDVYSMLPNIRAHSIIVARVAYLLAMNLEKAGILLSTEKVIAGALLHDIGKTLCLNTNEDHAVKGREICLAEKLDDIADIVAEHVILKSYDLESDPNEKAIVYYADKRVNHDVVVDLGQRLEYILNRYGRENENLKKRIKENYAQCVALEKKMFSLLDFQPSDVAHQVIEIEITNPS